MSRFSSRTGQSIGRPGGHRSCFVAMAPKCKAEGAIVCDRYAGVRCQPRRSKRAAWDNLIEVGNAGWRGSDAVAPSFLVRVRVGQSQRDAVEQHPKFNEAADRAGAEAGAGAAGCKLSESAGGEAGKAGREAGGADDAMDFEGDEAGGEADGKAAADLSGADRCGAGTASGCEADGEAGGAGRGELGEAGREVCGANDGTNIDGDETGGEANAMVVADLIGREADGSEDCGAHYGEDTELGHVRRELFAELGEVGASAAAAASTAAAAAASAASAAATAPTEPPPLPERAWKSIVL